MENNQLSALITLLDDPDETIYNQIREKLISIGPQVIPALEDAWGHSIDSNLQVRIEGIIHTIQYSGIRNELKVWAQIGSKDLLRGAIIVAKYQYPDLNEEKIFKQIERIKQDVWLELNANLTALEIVKVLNHIVFEIHGFSGNNANFHAPENSFINTVLESKKGNPLSLSIIYSVIAQKLGLPIYGVNLPEHFVLAYTQDDGMPIILNEHTNKVLFYINVFSKGTIFNKKEIDNFLSQLKLAPRQMYYEPCNNVEIITRVIRNLINAYEKMGDKEKAKEIESLLKCLS